MSFGRSSQRRLASSLFGGRGSALKIRLIIAAAMIGFAVIGYFSKTKVNPITGEYQRVGMSQEQEISMGLQATPSLIKQYGGYMQDRYAQARVQRIGGELLGALAAELRSKNISSPYRFDFHLLDDSKTINAFALPGGQVFVTNALYRELTDGQLAGVLGHEIGHVLERHGAQRMAKQQLSQGVAGGFGVAGGSDTSARMAQMIGQMVNMKYGQNDELESDEWGVKLCEKAGYDPGAMIGVMEVLKQAAGGKSPPALFSSHPPPADRMEKIKHFIRQTYPDYPDGLPPHLKPETYDTRDPRSLPVRPNPVQLDFELGPGFVQPATL